MDDQTANTLYGATSPKPQQNRPAPRSVAGMGVAPGDDRRGQTHQERLYGLDDDPRESVNDRANRLFDQAYSEGGEGGLSEQDISRKMEAAVRLIEGVDQENLRIDSEALSKIRGA